MSNDFSLYLDVQNAIDDSFLADSERVPDNEKLTSWVKLALTQINEIEQQQSNEPLPVSSEYELTIRIVDKEEIQTLNKTYRHIDKATNVLSFPYEDFPFATPLEIQLPLLGDLVICHEVVVEQAQQNAKRTIDHWAHMVIHGVLHLKGYDHIDDDEAQVMEALEVSILKKINVANPYQ